MKNRVTARVCCVSMAQVDPDASALNTNDVFVLKSPTSLVLWKGQGASSEEMAAAKYVAGLLGGSISEVSESKEPGEFRQGGFELGSRAETDGQLLVLLLTRQLLERAGREEGISDVQNPAEDRPTSETLRLLQQDGPAGGEWGRGRRRWTTGFTNREWLHVQVEEVPGEFTQTDLASDDVMILDTWDQVSLIGNCWSCDHEASFASAV